MDEFKFFKNFKERGEWVEARFMADASLVIFGFIRDKREHSAADTAENDAQESLPFPAPDSSDHEHRGAAMSRL